MISNIDNIKSGSDIVSIIGDFVKLTKKGSESVGLCPFHNERTPSFSVSKAKNLFKCFGCGKSGNAVDFVMDYEGKNFVEAIKYVADKSGIPIEEEYASKKQYVKPSPRLTKINPSFLSWFEKERMISNNVLLRLKITESKEWMPKGGDNTPVICFNYYRDEILVNIKFRAGKDKDFKLSKDGELIFYNIDSLKREKTAVIVEGEMDVLAMYEAGIYNVVSVPNGASVGNQKLEYLDNCWNDFEGKEKIILMMDNDESGYALREELARRLGKDRCYKVNMPDLCKDANDVLIKWGKDTLKEITFSGPQWPIEGIISMDDMFEDIKNFYENGYPKGVDAKVPGFDELLTFMPGQLTTVTGIPGHGKSEFIDYLTTSISKNHQWSWGICSFENQPSAFHATKIMEKFAGKSFAHRKDPEQRMNNDDFDNAIYNVDKFYHFINIPQIDVTLTGILNKAKDLVRRKGIKGLLIDPWNYIEHKVPPGQTETQYTSESLTELRTFAIQNGVHIFLIAHPTKMSKDKKTGQYEIPTMYNISGSAHFYNKTDNGICVYRDFMAGLVDIYVQKVRYSWLGKIGFCSFTYDTFTRQYKYTVKL